MFKPFWIHCVIIKSLLCHYYVIMLTFMDTRLVGLFGGMSAHLMADSAGPSDGHWRALLVLVVSGIQNSEKSILAENTTNQYKIYKSHFIHLHSTWFNFIQLHSLISIEVKHARWSGEAGLWPAQIVLKASKASLSALRWSALRLFGQRLSCCLTPATNGNETSFRTNLQNMTQDDLGLQTVHS